MGRFVRLNFDELRTIIKMFRDEGEDIIQLHAALRDRVRDLHKDWEGEGSEKFFKEMENDLLPALSRLSKALFFAQDTLQKIIKIIHDHDEDTKRFFNIDLSHAGNLGAFVGARQTPGQDFGNVMGSGITGDAITGVSGGVPGGDVGAQPGPPEAPAAGQAQGAAAGAGVAAQQGAGGGGGGGGAGGEAGQGLQGGLGSMGGGVGGAAGGSGGSAAGGGAAGGGAPAPDHIFEGSAAGGGAGGAAQTAQGGAGAGGGAAQEASGGGGAAAAGGAGVAGTAAAGGAGKAFKGRVTKKKK